MAVQPSTILCGNTASFLLGIVDRDNPKILTQTLYPIAFHVFRNVLSFQLAKVL